jgi:Rrf2 family protein
MDVIRRNTDYAFRLMLNLAQRFGGEAVSSRVLSTESGVSYRLTCKLMQELKLAGLLKSRMGPKGGFCLAKSPEEISLADTVEAVQGKISMNRCLLGDNKCLKWPGCTIGIELGRLQQYVDKFLSDITFDKLLEARKENQNLTGV